MQSFVQHHDDKDADGNPAGGHTTATGISIRWQNGTLMGADGTRQQPNGAFVEDVIEAAILRIEFYQQRTKFHCVENAVALGHLYAAREALAERTRARMDRGVEGTHAT